MRDFHLLEFVNRGRETQLQVGENVNKITYKVRIKNKRLVRDVEDTQ